MKVCGNFKIEIMAVGSELLSPDYVDTNSLFLTRQLNELGLQVAYKTVVGDDADDLLACFRTAAQRADLILITGGLGPTRDDLTRETLAAALGRKLVFLEPLWKKIQDRFARRGIKIAEVNRKQAYLIEGAEALENPNGTAPGVWLEAEGRIFALLPGPPRELEPMVTTQILPRLGKKRKGYQVRKVLKITGLAESDTETLISDLYPEKEDFQMTVLSAPGQIEIHCTALSSLSATNAEENLHAPVNALLARLGSYVFSTSGEELEEVVGRMLAQDGKTLAVAESCTGGLLGDRITDVPGSSAYFLEGIQAYSNEAKIRRLGVPPNLLDNFGAVSAEVAACMADNIRSGAGADYGLAITGIAGPSGGSREKPVGLVYVALSGPEGTQAEKNLFLGDRRTIKKRSSQKALDMLRLRLEGKSRKPAAGRG